MKKRMIKLMTIFCMAGILTVNPVIIGLAEEESAVGADVSEGTEEEPASEDVIEELEAEADVQGQNESNSEPATDVNYVKKVIWNYNNYVEGGITTPKEDKENFKVGGSISFPVILDKEVRNGYEFIGWYKDGELVQSSKEESYKIKEEDIGKELTFIAGWRQTVSAAIDSEEYIPMEGKEAPSKTEVTYQFPNISETTDIKSFTFANKWMINDKGPFEAGTTFTLEFGDTYGECIYNVYANETYGIEANKAELKLDSCLKPTNDQHAVLVANQSDYTIERDCGGDVLESIDSKTEAYVGTIEDSLTFYEQKSGATFSKTIKDILEQKTIKYIKPEDGSSHYVECNVLTIKNSDIVRTVNITYKDQYQDTKTFFTFNNEKANSCTYSENIYPGVKEKTWDEVLNKNIWAKRGTYKFGGWKYFLNGKEYTLEELRKKNIDFYTDEGTSLVVQPVWEGAYSYEVDPVIMDEGIKIPDSGSAIVGDSIELPRLDDIRGKYTFAGWRSSEDQKIYQAGFSYPIKEAETVFTAQWNPVSHKITFVDGTSEDTTTAEYGSDYEWNRLPKKEGYTFQGWKSKEWNEVYPALGELTVPAYDLTFTAQWKINSHQVKYDGNGGTKAPGSQQVDYNSKVTLSGEASRDGYTFVGWERISTGEVLSSGHSFVMPDMDETLKAKWKVAHSKISGKGSFYLVSEQSYTMGSGVKVQGDSSNYSENITFYVPQSGYYTFE